ncbi:MAG: UvrD-helicase domain-containing protein [Burkholderiales bacterium]
MNKPAANDVQDLDQRERALDVSQSFIVRAPAGSGKTRLLIQRYLALLATVDEPEEIIAITFTRKAAAEMRARVLAAFAVSEAGGDSQTRALATRVLARDTERGWQLLSNPARLRIQTIDSLNVSLTRQMPMMSRFGAQPESVDDASVLYRRAARQLLTRINDGDAIDLPIVEDIATLLKHLDNNLGVVESLIADMLRGRDQWLRNLPRMHEREALEAALGRVRQHAVADVAALFPAIEKTETLELVRFSGQNLLKDGVDRALSQSAHMPSFPKNTLADLPAWLAIADLLLTKEGTWRKRGGVNKNIGFPTSKDKEEKAVLDAMKSRIGDLLDGLAANPQLDALAEKLDALRGLPAGTYTDAEWEVLGAIVRLLPHATAQLWDVFGAEGECDFTEIAQAASRALGADDEPTDLALALDYRIPHLLVDEFQDTSFAQFELLEKLTRGWTEGDGRTLFVVGDPMQSIYRFREAEVGLFLRARHEGLGSVMLTPLTLSVNFRSSAGIVAWVNQTFQRLMPAIEDAVTGVVPYSECVEFDRTPESVVQAAQAVSLHWIVNRKDHDEDVPAAVREAARVIDIIQQTRAEKPSATIALLIRNRNHLREIVPALKTTNITYRAVDIDPLNDRSVVQDLLALTRAVLHAGDRIAWLAILRAPWCGLTLNDLAALTQSAEPIDGKLQPDLRTVWDLLNDQTRLGTLSNDGQQRAIKLREVLAATLSSRRREMLREVVEQTWLALAGPACLQSETDLNDALTFLDLLEAEANEQSGGALILSLDALEARVQRLFSGSGGNSLTHEPDAVPPVQIMTIHKAKGLEFDTVIVAGLDRSPRNDDKKLLVWTEQADATSGDTELLLAPIREAGADDDADAIYQYITKLDRAKQLHEDVRLLYVAATRAERRLHLLATVTIKEIDKDGAVEQEIVAPKSSSLLAALWPAVLPSITPSVDALLGQMPAVARDTRASGTGASDTHSAVRGPMRLALNEPAPARLAALPEPLSLGKSGAHEEALAGEPLTPQIDFEWASDTARHVGTVVHLFLQRIATDGVDRWSRARIEASRGLFQRELSRLGVARSEIEEATKRAEAALNNTFADERGRWTLAAHREARSEWRLTALVQGALVNVALDRTFIDDHGVRWIIDFKTGSHEGADVDAFLDNEQRRYRLQLETYAALMRAMEGAEGAERPIKLGLYFPMLGGWREWSR